MINNVPYKEPAENSTFYGTESHFSEEAVFYQDVRIYGNLKTNSLGNGITIQDEGLNVGSQLGITTVNFIGSGVTISSLSPGTANITISSNIDGASANQVLYKNSTNTVVGSDNLTFDGSNLNIKGNLYLGKTDTLSGEIISLGGNDGNFGIFNDSTLSYTESNGSRRISFYTRDSSTNNIIGRAYIDENYFATYGRLVLTGGTRIADSDFYVDGGSDGIWGLFNWSTVVGRSMIFALRNEPLTGWNQMLRIYRNGITGSYNVDCPVSGTIFGVNGTKNFKIDHPIDKTKNLVHVAIEGPRADLIYRGKIKLKDGKATVNIDEEYGLIPGTWKALCRNPQVWVANNNGWDPCRGFITDEILKIQSKNENCTDEIDWMVIAERQDKAMYNPSNDENGRPILEPDKYEPKTPEPKTS